MSIIKIISGGQTGADQGALFGAEAARLRTGGTAPKGFHTETGPAPWLATRFDLVEDHDTGWKPRTLANVLNAGATLIVAQNANSPGTTLTRRLARNAQRPLRTVMFGNWRSRDAEAIEDAAYELAQWFESLPHHTILNVAGNRESIAPGIQDWTAALIKRALLFGA